MASASDNEMSNAHNITHVSNTEDCDLINSPPDTSKVQIDTRDSQIDKPGKKEIPNATSSPVSIDSPQVRSKCTPDTSKDSIATRDSQIDKPGKKRKSKSYTPRELKYKDVD